MSWAMISKLLHMYTWAYKYVAEWRLLQVVSDPEYWEPWEVGANT